MEDLLLQACKKLHFSSGLVQSAKKIKAESHLDFLLQLFAAELEERDIKRRNAYIKTAKFDIIAIFYFIDYFEAATVVGKNRRFLAKNSPP